MRDALTFDDCQIVPSYSEIESRDDCETISQFTRHFAIRLPLIGAPMDTVCGKEMLIALASLGAVGCPHRFKNLETQQIDIQAINYISQQCGAPLVGTIGATGDYKERTEISLYAGAEVILIDVAHGDHKHVRTALEWLNSRYDRNEFDIIAGNIATADAAKRLQDWGADALRVGVGGGSMCETRVRTGIGVPQLQAVMDVAAVASVPVISDGGIRYPGDVAKALAAGADTVMLGSMLAGTDEAPGELYISGQWPKESRSKVFRGSASASQKGSEARYVEGTSRLVPLKGPVKNVIETIMDGVRSAMSYLGVNRVEEMRQVAEFVRISNAGLVEAHPHGLTR